MQKRTLSFLIFGFIGFAFGFSQLNTNGANNAEAIAKFKSLPQERIFLHYNANVLFTGERFFYSVYSKSTNGKGFSNLSQVAYVELISENGTSIVKQKVLLEGGRGYGDFFISEEWRTGSYKIVAYTNWMKNFGVSTFFKSDIVLINPYQKVANKYLITEYDSLGQPILKTDITAIPTTSDSSDKIQLVLDKETDGFRQPVRLSFKHDDANLMQGSYSLSIAKRSDLLPNWDIRKEGFTQIENDSKSVNGSPETMFWSNVTSNTTFFLPEMRGELISGRILNSENDLPVSGSTIALSIPGEDYLLKTATTNGQGQFFMNVAEAYGNSTAVVNNLSGDWNSSRFLLDDHPMDYGSLGFMPFKLHTGMERAIQERSVQNQIANAYSYLRQDTPVVTEAGSLFYRQMERTFKLDDFTRFKTLKETFIEVINQVGIRRTREGKRVFQVFTDVAREKSGLQPMLFVDGVFISDHEGFMDYDARKIDDVSYSKGLYRLGPISFDGILVINTIDKNFNETFYAANQLKTPLKSAEGKKKYFKQNYSASENTFWSRIPDFRRQLLWIPEMRPNSEKSIEFFTSNVPGIYDVVLNGFDGNGTPISATTSFTVE